MILTERTSGIGPSWLSVQGTGTVTGADGSPAAIAPYGWNVLLRENGLMEHAVLLNLVSASSSQSPSYGQFNGDLVNGDLVGRITEVPAKIAGEYVPVLFTRQ
ncbi:MAG TPA: hypothetical protein VM032_13360 [Vicinamibacterales bacterium]|nr:hypothetical protein [Vicinamibacterales bacterium]